MKKHPIRASIIIIAVVFFVYVCVAFFLTRHALEGTRLGGIDVSGDSHDEVVESINSRQEHDLLSASFSARGNSESIGALSAESVGISLDVDASAQQVAGFTLNPVAIAKRFERARPDAEVGLVKTYDDEKLKQVSEQVAHQLSVEKRNAVVYLAGQGAVAHDGQDGVVVNAHDVEEAMRNAFDEMGWELVNVPAEQQPAEVSDSQADSVAQQLNDVLKGGDLSVDMADGKKLTVPVSLINQFGYFDDKLELQFREEEFRNAVMKANPGSGDSVTSARFEFRNGQPHVVPAKEGKSVDAHELSEAVRNVIDKPGSHSRLKLEQQKATVSTQDAESMKFPEVVGEFATDVPANKTRTSNLERVAGKVSGTMIEPGEKFDFNYVVGLAWQQKHFKSWVKDYAVEDYAVTDVSSQLATTLFNAALEAGLDINEQDAETERRSAYPVGRDVRVYW